MRFFFSLFSVKKGLEISSISNDVLDRKETFLIIKTRLFQRLKNSIFPKGVTHASGQKTQFFSLFVFAQNNSRNNS